MKVLVTGGTGCVGSHVTPRPLRETVRDTILWLHRQGHLSARDVGTLADAAA